jgi:CopG family transcriptional regulator, nickel-responsive regulator
MRRSNQLKRFGVPMEEELLKPFDNFVRKRARRPFPRRSLTVRAQLVEERLTRGGAEVMRTLTVVYDHHQRERQDKLTDDQHHLLHAIVPHCTFIRTLIAVSKWSSCVARLKR